MEIERECVCVGGGGCMCVCVCVCVYMHMDNIQPSTVAQVLKQYLEEALRMLDNIKQG